MFTIEQIKTAHSKVKSGADFPAYIQEMKTLGVISYEHFVSDGHIQYTGNEGFSLLSEAKWLPFTIAATGSIEKLKHFLALHQQGQSDYPTFCRQAAEVGVEKWLVDMEKMLCIYYDKIGSEMLAEAIPSV